MVIPGVQSGYSITLQIEYKIEEGISNQLPLCDPVFDCLLTNAVDFGF